MSVQIAASTEATLVQVGQGFKVLASFTANEDEQVGTELVVEVVDPATGEVVGEARLPISVTRTLEIRMRDANALPITVTKSTIRAGEYTVKYTALEAPAPETLN